MNKWNRTKESFKKKNKNSAKLCFTKWRQIFGYNNSYAESVKCLWYIIPKECVRKAKIDDVYTIRTWEHKKYGAWTWTLYLPLISHLILTLRLHLSSCLTTDSIRMQANVCQFVDISHIRHSRKSKIPNKCHSICTIQITTVNDLSLPLLDFMHSRLNHITPIIAFETN